MHGIFLVTFVVTKCYICGNLFYVMQLAFFTFVVDLYIHDDFFSHVEVLHLFEFLHLMV